MTNFSKTVLVTGGAGYIGSHCVIKLIEEGYDPLIYDDFSNSSEEVLKRIKDITGTQPRCIQGDIRDQKKLEQSLKNETIFLVMHFAGKKSVSESEKDPLLYYSVNVGGTLTLLNVMEKLNIQNIIFSSTATVYGNPLTIPSSGLLETAPLSPINHYGKSKLCTENILQSIADRYPSFGTVILRYFNPVGAHESGLIGEDPKGIPANLMPYIVQVGAGIRKKLNIFGNDYSTRDGTGARDYIHIDDLAAAHIAALNYLKTTRGCNIFNIGTGCNFTVLELLKAFEETNDIKIPYEFSARRSGDSGCCFANPSKANSVLGWRAKKTLSDMCRDAWRWQKNNPNGLR